MTGFTWYVALVRSGHETLAEAHLTSAGFIETFCPRRLSSYVIRGRTTNFIHAVASGYVLCRTDLFTPDLWHAACPEQDTAPNHGLVRGFIGGWPADPVPESCVVELKSYCDEAGTWLVEPEPEFIVPYSSGDYVLVTDGLWQGHLGIVHRASVHGVWLTVQTTGFLLYIPLAQVGPSDEPPQKLSRFRLPKNVRRGPYGEYRRA